MTRELRPCDVPFCGDTMGGHRSRTGTGRPERTSLARFGYPDLVACKSCYSKLDHRYRAKGEVFLDVEYLGWTKSTRRVNPTHCQLNEFARETNASKTAVLKLVGKFRESERKRMALRDRGLKILNRRVTLDDFTNFGRLYSMILVRAVLKKNHRLILGRHEFADTSQYLGNSKQFA